MPIFRINGQLHYYAHVPKCGGTSVETYLQQRFGNMALYEPLPPNVRAAQIWSRTTAQHIPVWALDRLIPPEWIASSFATVRDPVDRLISDFHFWRDKVKSIPPDADFDAWFDESATRVKVDPFFRDGHLLPQSSFVPENARVFRLEDGLDAIPAYIDSLTGSSDGPREMPVEMVGRYRQENARPVPSAATLAHIARVYAVDYARFGYDIPETDTDTPHPPWLAASDMPADAQLSTRLPPVGGHLRQDDRSE
jgi:Sulfotransferase family